jgi:DNA-binding MarR family transcriptional regulator
VASPSVEHGEGTSLISLIDETRLLFHRLRAVAKELHEQGEATAGRRGILWDLGRLGPQTVPQMARARPVSRQHIQVLVNQLVNDRLVEFVENPAHRRSHLVSLTPKGQQVLRNMKRREAAILSTLVGTVPERDLRAAADVLRAVRMMFESSQYRRSVRAGR